MQQSVRNFLQTEIDQKHIPGAVIHVAHRGEVLLEEAIGYRSVYPNKQPMTLDVVFDLASLTKVVATLPALLKLLDEGEIRLDDHIKQFLPEFQQKGKENITIRHLLTHTSGLKARYPFDEDHLTARQILEQIYVDEQETPIGQNVIYSDLGMIALYKVIETVTQEDFSAFVQKNIFEPLNMYETTFNPTYPKERYAATEFSKKHGDYKRGIVHDENAEAMGGVSGHAGLFSTVRDLSKFATMIENDGLYQGRRILSRAGLKLSQQNFTPWAKEYRGLGWMLKSPVYSSCGDYFSKTSFGHTGFTGTSIWFDPEVKLRIILLTNRVHYGRKDHILRLRPCLHNIVRAFVDTP